MKLDSLCFHEIGLLREKYIGQMIISIMQRFIGQERTKKGDFTTLRSSENSYEGVMFKLSS